MDHLQKVLITLILYWGLRGRLEPTYLMSHQVEIGRITDPGHRYEGCGCVTLKDLQDKTLQVTIYNTLLRDGSSMRLPFFDEHDMNDLIASVKR